MRPAPALKGCDHYLSDGRVARGHRRAWPRRAPSRDGRHPGWTTSTQRVVVEKGPRRAKHAPASEPERVDERLKRRRLMTSAWIVQEVAVERRAPVLEHPHEPAARYVVGHLLLEQESQSQSVQRSTGRERGVAEDEGPRDGHGDGLAPLLELPSVDGPARADAVADAAVRRQVPRHFRLRV